MRRLVAELGRRNVIRMAGLYLVTAWLLVQVAETLLPIFAVPEWVLRAVVIVLALGFVPALVFAWVYELTPKGLKRDHEVPRDGSIAPQTGRRMDRLILVGIALIVALMLGERFWPSDGTSTVDPPTVATNVAPGPARSVALSVAVLPFADLSAAHDQEYLGDGIAEELLNALTRIDGLSVASRTSSFAYKGKPAGVPEIAAALKVGHVVEGSVRKSGNRLRITAQLIDVASDRHLWSQTFERELTDVFAIQDEIARAVADALSVKLKVEPGTRSGTRDQAAYDRYLLGLYHWNQRTPESLQRALGIFEQAVELDPGFARAWAGLAMTYYALPEYVDFDPALARERTLASARKALDLDPGSAEAHTVLAAALNYYEGRHREAAAEYERAIALDPKFVTAHHWKGILLTVVGDLTGSEVELRRALELDPASMPVQNFLGINLFLQQRTAEALDQAETVLQRGPDYRNSLIDTFLYAATLGRAREYLPRLRRYFEVVGEDPTIAVAIVDALEDPALRAVAIAALERVAKRHLQGGRATQMGALFALLHAQDQTLDILERDYDAASPMNFDSLLLVFLRGNPRYEALVERIAARMQEAAP